MVKHEVLLSITALRQQLSKEAIPKLDCNKLLHMISEVKDELHRIKWGR